MNDNDLLRYKNHIMLNELDVAGQQKLLNSHVVLIGCGGLGSPIALYLASSGIGKLTLIDFDVVELSNLQRQIAHQTNNIGDNKSQSCKQSCLAINPDIQIETIQNKLNYQTLLQFMQQAQANVMIDATDNFASRYAINRVSVNTKTPLVSGAAMGFNAQLTVLRPDLDNTPCYQCLYPNNGETEQQPTCSESGVIAPLVGIVGSLQALEAIKIIASIGQANIGTLQHFDAKTLQWKSMKYRKDAKCPICNTP